MTRSLQLQLIRNLCTSRSAPVKLSSSVLLYFHSPRGRIEYSHANNFVFHQARIQVFGKGGGATLRAKPELVSAHEGAIPVVIFDFLVSDNKL